MKIDWSAEFNQARELDTRDPLAAFRDEFLFPQGGAGGARAGRDLLYFAGNSLGLQPRRARRYIEEELEDWQRFGVEGHVRARHPWLPYHEFLTENLARIVGAKSTEVVAMNTLTVNLHLMMVSFYRPTRERYKILIGLVVPRPIAWVSTFSENGVANCAPFSFFNVLCTDPPIVAVGFTARNPRLSSFSA